MRIGDIDLAFYVERDRVLVKVDRLEWAKFFEDLPRRTIMRSIVSDTEIITVCTGHNAELTVPPALYQTGVFARRTEKLGPMKREWFYATRDAAERGHRRIVDAVRRGDRLGHLRVEPE